MPKLYGIPEFEDETLKRLIKMDLTKTCAYCKHHQGAGASKCAAFPEQIPSDILTGRKVHTKPVEGDHGIQFEPKEKGKKDLSDLSDGELAGLIEQTIQTVEEAGKALVERQGPKDDGA